MCRSRRVLSTKANCLFTTKLRKVRKVLFYIIFLDLSSPGPSTTSGTSTSRQTITRDMVREAMASARSVAHTSSQMQVGFRIIL